MAQFHLLDPRGVLVGPDRAALKAALFTAIADAGFTPTEIDLPPPAPLTPRVAPPSVPAERAPASWWGRLMARLRPARPEAEPAKVVPLAAVPPTGDAEATWPALVADRFAVVPPRADDLVFLPAADRSVLRELTGLLGRGPAAPLDWHVRVVDASDLPTRAEFAVLVQRPGPHRLFVYAADAIVSQRLGRYGLASVPVLVEPVAPVARASAEQAGEAAASPSGPADRPRVLIARGAPDERARAIAAIGRAGLPVELAHEMTVEHPTATGVIPEEGGTVVIDLADEAAEGLAWPSRSARWFASGVPLLVREDSPAARQLADIGARWRREQASAGVDAAAEGTPDRVVGRTFADEAGLVEALAEVLANLAEYERTARIVGPRFAAAHNPGQTIAQLVRRTCVARLRPSRAA